MTVKIGLERLIESPPDWLKDARLGLLMNQASVDRSFRYACDLVAERFPGQLRALFSPQHGLWGEEQANMIESSHTRYEPLELPVHSLYSETRRPSAQMLAEIDVLLIDLQDVGTRVYTFIWTVRECLIACAAAGVRVLILDRPNPISGQAEGPLLAPGYESFVGGAAIPLRHGLTLGELALLINREQHIGAELEVVRSEGWRSSMLWPEVGRAWVAPSPNMPRFETALLYPGQVLLEGTNLSEGRGTTLPFEVVGAPFIDPHRLLDELAGINLPGLVLRPVRFVPTFDKWRGQRCGGIALHITDPEAVRSVAATIKTLAVIRRLYPQDFAWLPPPYEYEREKMPIDILFGSPRLREATESEDLVAFDAAAWSARTAGCLLYG
jgi:uncharacterized protein YbbC (DUF1343 family)